jgi:hypothetical protein
LKSNRETSKIINEKYTYENSILAHEYVSTRGYSNLLFGRGIYENTSFSSLKEIAFRKNKTYIILFQCDKAPWNMYNYNKYVVYDVTKMEDVQ